MKELRRRTFTNGFVAVLELHDGMKIETTATCLPISTEMRGTDKTDNVAVDYNNFNEGHWKEKFMIGISTQSGCSMKCKFCNVNKLTEKQGYRNLTSSEMIEQVQWAINASGYDPKDSQLFRVLFTRMGEPSCNIDNVIEAIRGIKALYPEVRIQISTIGVNKLVEKLVKELVSIQIDFKEHFIELQFSIHSTDDNFRKWLQSPKVASNKLLNAYGYYYNTTLEAFDIPVKWKVTLNFALAIDTPFDSAVLKSQFSTDYFFVKISPVNENEVSEENNLKTLIQNANVI